MRKLKYCLSLMIFLSSISVAQDRLTLANGQVLEGKVEILIAKEGNQFLTIKVGKKKQTYKVLETRMIETESGDVIKPLGYSGQYKFAKEISYGFLSHYKVTEDRNAEPFSVDVLFKMDGSSIELAGKIAFRARLRKFTADCYQISDAIQKKQYSANDLERLVADYNACVSKNGLLATNDAQKVEQTQKLEISKSLEQKLNDFSALLEHSDKITNKKDVTAMFNDLSGKLRRKETVPDYLKTALSEALKKDSQLSKLILEIFKEK